MIHLCALYRSKTESLSSGRIDPSRTDGAPTRAKAIKRLELAAAPKQPKRSLVYSAMPSTE